MLNSCVLSRARKTATEGAEVTRSGWQIVPDTSSGDRESSVTDSKSRVRLTINDEDELERSR